MLHIAKIAASLVCLTALMAISTNAMAPALAAEIPANASVLTVPNPLFAGGLFVNPSSPSAVEATRLIGTGATATALQVKQISTEPIAIWLGDWWTNDQLARVLAADVAAARKAGTTLTFVTYAIPGRDCGGYSAGGFTNSTYLAWNAAVAHDLQGTHSVVIVEPDAVAMLATPACASYVSSRPLLLKSAVDTLVGAGLTVYLDAGNSHWIAPKTMAPLLLASGVADARGISTNVANYNSTAEETVYADQISTLVGGTHYVIDTSRNGANRTTVTGWCNPTGAALGQNPAVASGATHLDALLWVKPPGASDGTCNGGPAAGQWWLANALALVNHRGQ